MMISNYGTESAVSPIASISPITGTGRSGSSQSTPALEKPRSPIRRFCEKLWPNKPSTISSSSSGDLINPLSLDATNSLSISVLSRTSKHQQLEKVFKFFDRDGDGLISPTELSKCLKTMGDNISEEEAVSALRLIDSDGDGFLGFDEFKALMIGDDRGSGGADIREAFAMYAVEGEDRITSSSLKRMLSKLGEKKSVEECRRMIKRFDVNGDGVLSFEEFHQMMTMAP